LIRLIKNRLKTAQDRTFLQISNRKILINKDRNLNAGMGRLRNFQYSSPCPKPLNLCKTQFTISNSVPKADCLRPVYAVRFSGRKILFARRISACAVRGIRREKRKMQAIFQIWAGQSFNNKAGAARKFARLGRLFKGRAGQAE